MKVLYVSPHFPVKNSGGCVVSKRNYAALCNYYGENNVISYPIIRRGNRNPMIMLLHDLMSLGWGYSNRDKKEIIEVARAKEARLVFFDSSLYGGLARCVKRRLGVKTIVFFHNVEYDFVKSLVVIKKSYLYSYRIFLAYKNEKDAIKGADEIISLTQKDSLRLNELYGRKADKIIPVSLRRKAGLNNMSGTYSAPIRLLFFGSNFPPNIEAIGILINEILPSVNAHLVIAGNGMEELNNAYPKSNKYEIRGFVEDVDALYSACDIVVLPIMSGSGMKVKTAEALMYGKNIIATGNALEGYDTKSIPGVVKCETSQDFINAINSFDTSLPWLNIEAQKSFLLNYSHEAALKSFKEVFEGLEQ